MSTRCSYEKISLINKQPVSLSFIPDFYQEALKDASKAALLATSKYKVGCCIVSNKKSYLGFSSTKSHPLQLKFNSDKQKIYLHSEISCLSKIQTAKERLFLAVTVRLLKNGDYADSAPCDSCLSALMAFKVENIMFYREGQWEISFIGK